MEPDFVAAARSGDAVVGSVRFGDELDRLMKRPHESASSFTALLELPPTHAMELIHSPAPLNDHYRPYFHPMDANLTFPSNTALIERAAMFSVFAGEDNVKNEPVETDANPNSVPESTRRRKEREKKGKGSTKKSSEETEKLPYVHVRARRGQATNSHSLAERARREKINARMKLLQELVPGCNKISGTALVLDEIINHVQSLQHQVEFLSMKLAAVNPRVNFNLDSILAAESGSPIDSSYTSMFMPLWPEVQVNGKKQHQRQQWHVRAAQQPVWGREDHNHNLITSENSLSSHASPANSVSVHLNRLKMER